MSLRKALVEAKKTVATLEKLLGNEEMQMVPSTAIIPALEENTAKTVSSGVSLVSGPTFTNITETTVQVSWVLSDGSPGQIRWGTSATALDNLRNGEASSTYSSHSQLLEDLPTGAEIFLQIFDQINDAYVSDIKSFTTVAEATVGASTTTTDGYLTDLVPVAEGTYIDYSSGIDSTLVRDLYTTLGCDIDELHARVGTTLYEPAPTIDAINAAIQTAAVSGGIVRPTFSLVLQVDDTTGTISGEDNVIFDGSNIGTFLLTGGASGISQRISAIRFDEKEWFGITNINTDGSNELNYGVRVESSRNFLIQNITTVNHDQNSVRLSNHCQYATVRFCNLKPGTTAQGNGTQRNQHGIVSGSFAGPAVGAASGRFGIVYSWNHAYYSNIIRDGDGNSIDAHASNIEMCGNYTDNYGYGPKFPHSANILSHNNNWGVANQTGNIAWRVYSANDWDVGVGYECDKLFFFDETFDVGSSKYIRFDGIHGDVYFIDNSYTAEGGTLLIANANSTSTDPNSFNGRVFLYGDDLNQPINDSTSSGLTTLTDTLLQNKDVDRMIELMNETKNPAWAANVDYPLPTVVRRT